MIMSYVECSAKEYIASKTTIEARILAIEALIDKMLLDTIDQEGNAPSWVDNAGTASYSMDDGQMKVMTQYRSPEGVLKGIQWLEKIKQIYINQYNGRVNVLRGRLNYY